ncbi:DUF5815 family protein [Halovenus rubra]|uniref:DUF5815 family protein n=2 Tax=Halovenus rubra TaxID=869890 RepID=A0ABD5X2B8_9EURY|nr:DUF5815 family protein [Halovenus rubra]
MPEPGIPGESGDQMELPCGEVVHPTDFDIGMREFHCPCGDIHALVTDVHPLARFVPEFLVGTLRETISTDDDFEEFGTPHALAMAAEEFPDKVESADCSTEGSVGYALIWISTFNSRRLHEVVVELLLELMEHAVSHTENEQISDEFEAYMADFELETFVELYREEREFETEHDTAI